MLLEVFAIDLANKVEAGQTGLSPYALYITALVNQVLTG